MFGSKKNKIEEQVKEMLSQITDHRTVFETSVAQVEEGGKRIHTDVCQVMENTSDLANYAMQNIEEESILLHSIDDFSKELRMAVDEYAQLREELEKQYEAITALVEENKHYTTPSKYLTEAPGVMKQSYETMEKQMDAMAEDGRKMSVMALNAAIEAGRMGEAGKQFVTASEEIRQTALGYEKAALFMKEEVELSKAKMEELEEVVHRLVSLLKENNMSTTRLLKKSQESANMINNSSMRDFSEDMILIRDKVVGIRNLDEEIAKCGERNKIQLSDIQEEVQTQKSELAEMESDLSHLLDSIEEQIS